MATRNEDHERAAAGMDYDSPIREKASQLGSAIAENGPDALFEEIENLLPESWREHVAGYPITAMLIGLGVGLWLGMRKGDEVIAAGTSLISAAAMQNVSSVMGRAAGQE
jgi:hypothetical protein